MFDCNRDSSLVESKEVVIPGDFECKNCVLQYIWITPDDTYYSCIDISVRQITAEGCLGECENGEWKCVEPYYGELCEIKGSTIISDLIENETTKWIFIGIIVLIFLLIICSFIT